MRALPLIAAGVVDLADEPKETRIVRGYERKGTA
jgi:hypothetical protein